MGEITEITEDSQYKLEVEIRNKLAILGFKLFALNSVPGVDDMYRISIDLHKKLVEYFDNTRLMENTVKENITL